VSDIIRLLVITNYQLLNLAVLMQLGRSSVVVDVSKFRLCLMHSFLETIQIVANMTLALTVVHGTT